MKVINVYPSHIATVNDEDYDILITYKWRYRDGYAVSTIRDHRGSHTISMHKIILNVDSDVDHKNGNKLCNERWNLRPCTKSQNNANRPASNIPKTSKYKGVSQCYNKWKSVVYKNKKQFYLGLFDTEELAAIAYNTKAKELHGEFAYLNEVVL